MDFQRDRDRGAATVWVLASGLMTVLVALAMSAAGAGIVARHRAQGAADLGALAGATRAIEGEESACATAGSIVAANGGRMARCGLEGLDVIVTVEVSPALVAAFGASARANARAGPATDHIGDASSALVDHTNAPVDHTKDRR